MRVELLFLRWLLIIAIVVIGIVYARSARQKEPMVKYETLPLIQGGRSSGMPLAGIVVDPQRRDVYAIVGGPTQKEGNQPFCIVWKGKEGETFGTTFPPEGGTGLNELFEILPDGKVHAVSPPDEAAGALNPSSSQRMANAEQALRSIIKALPPAVESRPR